MSKSFGMRQRRNVGMGTATIAVGEWVGEWGQPPLFSK